MKPQRPKRRFVDLSIYLENDVLVDASAFLNYGSMSRGIGTPITLDGRAEAVTTPAPQVGEHSRAVLRELGCSDTEIDALIEAKAVQQV